MIPKIKYFFPREISIRDKKTFLYGAPQCGKTTLALWHAREVEHTFYIDCALLFSESLWLQTKQNLSLVAHNLELLIIDNITLHSLPYLQDIKEPSSCIYIGTLSACPAHFTPLCLPPLSFEEYLSIDKKNLSIENLLSNFIKDGNSPEMPLLPNHKKREYKWRTMQFALQDDKEIFGYMLALQSLQVSINSIYRHVKKYVKLSKDRIYPLIHTLSANNIVFLCPHVGDTHKEIPTKKYKLYFYDFSLSQEFAETKHFTRVYENMVFLELLSMGFSLQYSDYCDFIDTQRKAAIFCMPFASTESIAKRIQIFRKKEKEYSGYMIFAISMSYNHVFDSGAMALDFASLSPHLRIL